MRATVIADAKHAAEALVQKDEVAKVRTGQSFIQADRQADRQTDRHTDRQTGRQTDRRCRFRNAKPSLLSAVGQRAVETTHHQLRRVREGGRHVLPLRQRGHSQMYVGFHCAPCVQSRQLSLSLSLTHTHTHTHVYLACSLLLYFRQRSQWCDRQGRR